MFPLANAMADTSCRCSVTRMAPSACLRNDSGRSEIVLHILLACIASVSARVRRESWDKSKKKKEWGGGGEGEGSEGWKIRIKGRKTLADKSQRQIASCLQWKFCEIICLATRHKFTNSNWFDFANCGEDKILSKISVHRNSLGQAKWFVAATCLCDLLHRYCMNLQQLVARLVQKKWFITATCCSDMTVAWCVPTLKETISHKHRHKKKKEVPGEGTFQPSQTMIVKLKHVHAKISTYAIWRPQVLLNPPHGMSVWLGLVLINPSLHHHPQFPYQQKPYFLVAF